jgi:hypothetical protein
MKLSTLLRAKKNWCQNADARDLKGYPVGALDPEAVCFCLSGALAKCYANNRTEYLRAFRKLTNAIDSIDGVGIVSFNDNGATTFADIKKVVKLAGI